MGDRETVSTGTEWEDKVAYSRAVRVGTSIHVSGTTAVDAAGHVVGVGEPYAQTVHVLERIRWALRRLGADLENVVRTRIYTTDISAWEEIGRAHQEFFSGIRPATTLVEVARLISPEILVEIEADAILPGKD